MTDTVRPVSERTERRHRRRELARRALDLYAAGKPIAQIAKTMSITQNKAATLLGHGIDRAEHRHMIKAENRPLTHIEAAKVSQYASM
jgi:hypothetical protein